MLALVTACSAQSGTGGTEADEGALAFIECSAHPSCDEQIMGHYCLPRCAPECTSRHMATALWVSPYEVAGTLGFGRHQGLAIVSLMVDFDPRFSAEEGAAAATDALPADMVSTMVNAGAHEHGALCGAAEVVFDRPLGNHGRPLSRAPSHANNRSAMALSAVDAPLAVANDPKSKAPLGGAWRDRLTACLSRVTDGYCDSVCGNCSYVLPVESVVDTLAGDYSSPSDRIDGPADCSASAYYGGPGQTSQTAVGGEHMSNNFTHCARLGCSHHDEAPSLGAVRDRSAPMSGRYGHNSNTDAEAEFRAVTSCLAGREPDRAACSVCGFGASGVQDACALRTNTARATWERAQPTMAMLPEDEIEPITEAAGGDGPKPTLPPRCAWGSFRVHGM